jgi:hypothetical protein
MIAFGMQTGGDIPIIAGIEANSCFNFYKIQSNQFLSLSSFFIFQTKKLCIP